MVQAHLLGCLTSLQIMVVVASQNITAIYRVKYPKQIIGSMVAEPNPKCTVITSVTLQVAPNIHKTVHLDTQSVRPTELIGLQVMQVPLTTTSWKDSLVEVSYQHQASTKPSSTCLESMLTSTADYSPSLSSWIFGGIFAHYLTQTLACYNVVRVEVAAIAQAKSLCQFLEGSLAGTARTFEFVIVVVLPVFAEALDLEPKLHTKEEVTSNKQPAKWAEHSPQKTWVSEVMAILIVDSAAIIAKAYSPVVHNPYFQASFFMIDRHHLTVVTPSICLSDR